MMSIAPSLKESNVLGALELLLSNIKWPVIAISNQESIKADILKNTESRISGLLLAVHAIQRMADVQIARNRRLLNHLNSPLLRLPQEVISLIVEHVGLQNHGKCYTINALRLVCFRLYQVTESTPGLWAHIRLINPGLGWVRAQITKSRMVPLKIHGGRLRQDTATIPFLDLLCRHIGRWESVSLTINSTPASMQHQVAALNSMLKPLAQDRAHLLQKFVLIIRSPPGFHSFPLNLFDGYAPHLRNFEAPSLAVSWDNPIFSGLTYLDVCAWDGSKVPSARQYIQLLERCPELSVLKIRGRAEDWAASGAESFRCKLHLPRLTKLLLQNIHPQVMRSLLNSIQGSPSAIRLLFPRVSDDQIHAMRSVLQNPSDSMLLSNSYYSAQEVELSGASMMTARSEGRGDRQPIFLCQATEIYSALHFAQPLLVAPSRVKIRTLIISGDVNSDVPGCFPNQILEGLVGLEDLRVNGSRVPWFKTIMELLSTPIESPGSLVTWRCPSLQRLHFSRFYDLSTVLTSLTARYRHPSGQHPSSLSSLVLMGSPGFRARSNNAQDIALQIADVIGRDVFQWEGNKLRPSGQWRYVSSRENQV